VRCHQLICINAVAVKNELLGQREMRDALKGIVRLVIGAAEVDHSELMRRRGSA
jgi:hypothetical protein